jgi:hypothetical protein
MLRPCRLQPETGRGRIEMEQLVAWARGPAFIFSFTFMTLGLLRHVSLTLWQLWKAWRKAGDKSLPLKQVVLATLRWMFPAGRLKEEPLFSATSILFHVAILIVPVFLAGHVALWARGIGVSWPAVSNQVADVLTIVAVVTAAALLIQRLAARATRSLSRFQDYILPLIIALPFVSGFLVMHPSWNPFSFNAVLFIHVMSANLVMILIPVTKLTHAALFPDLQLVSEMGWHWPPDAGSKLAATLGKEGIRI